MSQVILPVTQDILKDCFSASFNRAYMLTKRFNMVQGCVMASFQSTYALLSFVAGAPQLPIRAFVAFVSQLVGNFVDSSIYASLGMA